MGKYDSDFLYILRELHKKYDENFEKKQHILIEKLLDLLEENLIKTKCKVCGDEIFVENNIFIKHNNHYCSWECEERDW